MQVSAVVSSKGRVTLPAGIRSKLGVRYFKNLPRYMRHTTESSSFSRSRESSPVCKLSASSLPSWIPACAGMTGVLV